MKVFKINQYEQHARIIMFNKSTKCYQNKLNKSQANKADFECICVGGVEVHRLQAGKVQTLSRQTDRQTNVVQRTD